MHDLLAEPGGGGAGGGGSPSKGAPPPSLSLREDKQSGVYLAGAVTLPASSADECLAILGKGAASLKVAATQMNRQSSRSHAVCRITVEGELGGSEDGGGGGGGSGDAPPPDVGLEAWRAHSVRQISEGITKQAAACKGRTRAVLTLCDLAGSEDVGRSGATGQALTEAKRINSSLLALGNVIQALTTAEGQGKGSKGGGGGGGLSHVPFRDSVLTRLLQQSIGGNCKTVLVSCISPADGDLTETLSTLRFAARARRVKNIARANVSIDASELSAKADELAESLQKQLMSSEEQLASARRRCEQRAATALSLAMRLSRYRKQSENLETSLVAERERTGEAVDVAVEAAVKQAEDRLQQIAKEQQAAAAQALADAEQRVRASEASKADAANVAEEKLRAAKEATEHAERRAEAGASALASAEAANEALRREMQQAAEAHTTALRELEARAAKEARTASERAEEQLATACKEARAEALAEARAEAESAAARQAERTASELAESAAEARRRAEQAEADADARRREAVESARKEEAASVRAAMGHEVAAAARAAEEAAAVREASLREASRSELESRLGPLRQELQAARDELSGASAAAQAALQEAEAYRRAAEQTEVNHGRALAAEQSKAALAATEGQVLAAQSLRAAEAKWHAERLELKRGVEEAERAAQARVSVLEREAEQARGSQGRLQVLVQTLQLELDEQSRLHAREETERAEAAAHSAQLRRAVVAAADAKAQGNAHALEAAREQVMAMERVADSLERRLRQSEASCAALTQSLEREREQKAEMLAALDGLGAARTAPPADPMATLSPGLRKYSRDGRHASPSNPDAEPAADSDRTGVTSWRLRGTGRQASGFISFAPHAHHDTDSWIDLVSKAAHRPVHGVGPPTPARWSVHPTASALSAGGPLSSASQLAARGAIQDLALWSQAQRRNAWNPPEG